MMNFIRSLQNKRPFPGKFSLSQLIWNFICISFHENSDLYCHNRVEIRKRIKCPLDQAVLVLNIFVTNFHQEKFDWSMLLVVISRKMFLLTKASSLRIETSKRWHCVFSRFWKQKKIRNHFGNMWTEPSDCEVNPLQQGCGAENAYSGLNPVISARGMVGWFSYQLKVDQICWNLLPLWDICSCVLYNLK